MFEHGRVKNLHPIAAPVADIKAVVVNQIFDAPHPAKLQLVRGHEEVVKRNPIGFQPFFCAAVRPPQIAVSADNNPPLVGS